ncbi:DUF4402 domain-containing protein [Alteromonas gilva]|uniref:DUF4402 domain-containing protein n=1 Tax=Alteromonas gilva TaxID=2987522 RepID=A0ABT5KZY7_9ALTE|nr:DUF4402 domain-containing protein [Alteromonas gilva]MDC8829761.1 DUF4402 domain-containing protein [Alteromonas gilva]
MKTFNKNLSVIGTALIATLAGSASAETVTVPVTLTVDNTIAFTQTGTLDFGTLRATADGSAAVNCVGLTMPANPASALNATLGTAGSTACTATGTAVIQNVGGTPTRPEFAVAGLAPFTVLTLTLPTTADLALNPAPAGAPIFRLLDFTAYQSSGTPGAVTTTVTADNVGDIAFTVGATIITDPTTASLQYENTSYTGDFDVTVSY